MLKSGLLDAVNRTISFVFSGASKGKDSTFLAQRFFSSSATSENPRPFSSLFDNVQQTKIRTFADKVNALRKEDIDVIDQTGGYPTHKTPEVAVDELQEYVSKGNFNYGLPFNGIEKYRAVYVDGFNKQNKSDFTVQDVTFFNGSTAAISALFKVGLSPKDLVLVPGPGPKGEGIGCYPLYRTQATIMGGARFKTVTLRPDTLKTTYQDYVDVLSASIEPGTERVYSFITNPHNPGGFSYTNEGIGEWLAIHRQLDKDFPEVSFVRVDDGIYESMSANHSSLPEKLNKDEKLQTVMLRGRAKDMNAGGIRSAAVISQVPDLSRRLAICGFYADLGANVPGQILMANSSALTPAVMDPINEIYRENMELTIQETKQTFASMRAILGGVEAKGYEGPPEGTPLAAFYHYSQYLPFKGMSVPEEIQENVGSDRIKTDEDLAQVLVNAHLIEGIDARPVATVPGQDCLNNPESLFLRRSCAGTKKDTKAACETVDQVGKYLARLAQEQQQNFSSRIM